ncbi:MAG: hypothetical protein AAGH46_04125, partial [Bacteroidota bacterium]
AKYDDVNFKFCDSSKVLHKRALIKYTDGETALEKEILEKYQYKQMYSEFSGYFIIRFAVNCKNATGRFRVEVLDSNFNETTIPEELKDEILSLFKNLNSWNHAVYQGDSYDGYTFRVIKIMNGKIDFS